MEDTAHLQVYRRFFAVLVSVLPGVNLVLGLSGLILFLFADVIELDWGVSIGLTSILMVAMFIGAIFVGILIQGWAEEKGAGLLGGICAPFIVIDAGLMLWLFVETVVFASSPGGPAEEAQLWVTALSAFG